MRAHVWFGNLEYTKHDTDGVGIYFFHLWLSDLKLEVGVCAAAICWAFSTKGHQNKNEKSPQSMLSVFLRRLNRIPSKQAGLVALDWLPLLEWQTFKIILHRIISVVWLTNFLSEIRSLSNHDDETQFHILSVKPIWSFGAFDHWWSLTAQTRAVMDGE